VEEGLISTNSLILDGRESFSRSFSKAKLKEVIVGPLIRN
jgi:hypothetical protein